jgi:RHS repeat-associated protein
VVTWIGEPFQHRWLARLDAEGACSVFSDHIGFPLRMIDGAGRTVWAARPTLLGGTTPLVRTGIDCAFRFPGQYEDEETGLVYNRWRYYDPSTGRYISKDPLGLRGGMEPYAYVPDPLRWIDPGGLQGEVTQEPFSMVGGSPDGPSPGPKGPRPNNDIKVDEAGNVKAQACDPANGVWPDGKSATVDPPRSGLSGTFYEVPSGTELPDGLAAVRDGAEVGGPHGPGHVTIYPTRDMPFEEFDTKCRTLPSEPKLKINDKGKITVLKCG